MACEAPWDAFPSDNLSTTWRARETARVELARLRVAEDASVEPAVLKALGISARATCGSSTQPARTSRPR
jgi:hypothetical protein